MKILGISFGHNSTAALLEDGKIIFCQSEERLDRLKNSFGFPYKTVDYILKTYGRDIDYAVFSTELPAVDYSLLKDTLNFKSVKWSEFAREYKHLSGRMILKYISWRFLPKLYIPYYVARLKMASSAVRKNKHLDKIAREYFAQIIGIGNEKLIFLNHHSAHALSPCLNLKNKTLIFTLDSAGDELCGTVSICDESRLDTISKTHVYLSLGVIWYNLVNYMGMIPHQDEHKVMGLAPYASKEHALRIAGKFKKFLWLNKDNEFESAFPMALSRFYYLDNFLYERFDNLAGGIQAFTEEIVTAWIRGWVDKTGINSVALAGGIFMNVKLNQKVASMDEVEKTFVMPSAGDESTVFGACYYGYQKYCQEHNVPFEPKPFHGLYLGQDFGDAEIKRYITENGIDKKYKVTPCDDIEKYVAGLLAENQIVARYKGPMEFGARALGNRSILANPSNFDNVRIINSMIKSRDFWMPFAPSIIAEDADRYIINSKKISAPYMVTTFDTTELGREHLKAAIHPYDMTTRPQILFKEFNPDYHRLIQEFKKLTGIGAVLNTSFNLHGEPIVMSPDDATRTFENSGLQYLALGNYIIEKVK